MQNVRVDQGLGIVVQSKPPDEPEILNWWRDKSSYIDKQCAIPVPFHRIHALPKVSSIAEGPHATKLYGCDQTRRRMVDRLD